MSPLRHSTNIAARMGRWSANHRKTAIFGWLAFVIASFAIGTVVGMQTIDPNDTSPSGVDGDGIGRGTEIVLNLSGNTVTGSAGGVDYFTITINPATGIATFTQLDNIWNPTPGANYDEAAILNTALASNFQVVQTVKDADGDTDTAAVNIGQGVFQMQDDGPVANPDTDTVAGNGGTATGNVITDAAAGDSGDSDTGADDIGEDTPGRVSFIDNANDGAAGVAVPTGGAGVDIAGQFGTLHIAANGDYTYTRSGGLGGGQSETFNYTLIDADGDTVVSTLTIQIADTVPEISPPGANGSAGLNWYLSCTIRTSGKLTPQAWMSTTSWLGRGSGSATSSMTRFSGGPYSCNIAARMRGVNRSAVIQRQPSSVVRSLEDSLGSRGPISRAATAARREAAPACRSAPCPARPA